MRTRLSSRVLGTALDTWRFPMVGATRLNVWKWNALRKRVDHTLTERSHTQIPMRNWHHSLEEYICNKDRCVAVNLITCHRIKFSFTNLTDIIQLFPLSLHFSHCQSVTTTQISQKKPCGETGTVASTNSNLVESLIWVTTYLQSYVWDDK